MKRTPRPATLKALTSLLAILLAASAGTVEAASTQPVAGYIVVYGDSVAENQVDAETNRLASANNFDSEFRYSHALKGFAAKLTAQQVNALRGDPNVAFVSVDRPVHAVAPVPLAPNEPVPPTGVRRIGAATTTTARQASVASVAIIDTGIDLTHPDLNAVDGKNCISSTSKAQDDNGHGTHVAGTVGAKNTGGIGAGIVGVAPGTRLFAVKVLDNT
ncbi:MAG: S8 family serine peptidase, partial [Chloroflexota bacterium]|nr:S8 family serine peptidase [Chloroflexota bacterium]